MRVTENSILMPYLRNLGDIQERRNNEQIRLSTGNNILSMGDNPASLVNVKQLTTLIDKNDKYQDNLDEALHELMLIDNQLSSISDKFLSIRQTAIDATQTSNSTNLYNFGIDIKGFLQDIIKDANLEFTGHFVFSGTKTTSDSLLSTPQTQTDMPFELIKGTATADNPSGLQVIFKGNLKDRIINKDSNSTEVINIKADTIFGAGGTEVYDSIIKLYNLLTYNKDGTERKTGDILSKAELSELNADQKKIADIYESLLVVSAQNGARINRLQSVKNQMQEEGTLLRQIRSSDSDTDVATSTINLKKEDTILQYALQVGSTILPKSIFDFLA